MRTRSRLIGALVLGLLSCGPIQPDAPLPSAPRNSTPTGAGGGFGGSGGFGGFGGGGGFSGFGGGNGGNGGALGCASPLEMETGQPVAPMNEPPPLMGGTLAAMRDGSFVAADPDRNVIWLVNASLTSSRTLTLAAGEEPGRVVEGPTGFAYLTLRRSNAIVEVNVAAGTMRRLTTCALPRGLAWRSSDARLIVGCLDGAVEQLDPMTGLRSTITTALEDVRDVVIDDDRLIVTSLRNARMSVVAPNGTITPVGARMAPVGFPFGGEPHAAWRAVPAPAAVGGVFVVRQQHSTFRVGTGCSAYAGLGPADAGVSVVLAEVTHLNLVAQSANSVNVQAVLPIDLAVNATGELAVVSAGTRCVNLPQGTNCNVGEPTSIVFSGNDVVVFSREPAALEKVTAAGLPIVKLTLAGANSVASTGHELFHRATAANLACASCHPEGGDDGHTWFLEAGPRRTPTLRGGLRGTAPFHWSGDLSSMGALMTDVMVGRMQGPPQSQARIDAIEAWLNSVPKVPAPAVDAAAAERGRVLFESESTGCSTCHAGPQGTNNQTLLVGTDAAMQVPRLTEFVRHGPWLHDGRMTTLGDRFNPLAGGTQHGTVSQLTPDQQTDLLEYLKTR